MPVKKKIPTKTVKTRQLKLTVSKKKVMQKATLQKAAVRMTPVKKQPVFAKAATRRGFSLRSLSLGPQFLIAGSAIALLLLLANVDRATFATRPSNAAGPGGSGSPVAIGLEHDAQASITMLLARKEGAGYASVSNESDVPLFISLPADWKRTEVSGASLEAVKAEIPVFGFKRWTLPAKSAMKLEFPSAPSMLLFDNSSPSIAMVDLTTVDLGTRAAENKVVLVQTQTNVELWKTEE